MYFLLLGLIIVVRMLEKEKERVCCNKCLLWTTGLVYIYTHISYIYCIGKGERRAEIMIVVKGKGYLTKVGNFSARAFGWTTKGTVYNILILLPWV